MNVHYNIEKEMGHYPSAKMTALQSKPAQISIISVAVSCMVYVHHVALVSILLSHDEVKNGQTD